MEEIPSYSPELLKKRTFSYPRCHINCKSAGMSASHLKMTLLKYVGDMQKKMTEKNGSMDKKACSGEHALKRICFGKFSLK